MGDARARIGKRVEQMLDARGIADACERFACPGSHFGIFVGEELADVDAGALGTNEREDRDSLCRIAAPQGFEQRIVGRSSEMLEGIGCRSSRRAVFEQGRDRREDARITSATEQLRDRGALLGISAAQRTDEAWERARNALLEHGRDVVGGARPFRALDQVCERTSDDTNDRARRIGGSTRVDARAEWRRGAFAVFGYARNLFDNFYLTYLFPGSILATAGDPRELGIGTELRF